MKRRIVQIAAVPSTLGESAWEVFALADDGTLWGLTNIHRGWSEQYPALPDSDTPDSYTSEPLTFGKDTPTETSR